MGKLYEQEFANPIVASIIREICAQTGASRVGQREIRAAIASTADPDVRRILDEGYERFCACSGRKGVSEPLKPEVIEDIARHMTSWFSQQWTVNERRGTRSEWMQEFQRSEQTREGYSYLLSETDFCAAGELSSKHGYSEGALRRVWVNRYERNRDARSECIRHRGTQCTVCGFDFLVAYGPLGRDYIHVHHVIPLPDVSPTYELDPVRDLVPVCPNCHAMLHREEPPLSIEKLKAMVDRNRKGRRS